MTPTESTADTDGNKRGKPILPPAHLGVLGGGQLGRMFAMAAQRMGYHVHVFDFKPKASAAQVTDTSVTAAYDDIEAAKAFASRVDAITFEFENIPSETLAAIEGICPVHPSPEVLRVCRNRAEEKQFLEAVGLPVGPFRVCHSVEDVSRGVADMGTPCILKTVEGGYDGKGQVRLDAATEAIKAWAELGLDAGQSTAVLEAFVPFEKEVSVVAARTEAGEVRTFGTVENDHVDHILDVTLAPAQIDETTHEKAQQIAARVLTELDVVGVLCVEMFLVRDADGREDVLINELAPRPHNSGHFSFDASVTSQFEQQVRALCSLPLGDPMLLKPAAMANVLGNLWFPDGPEGKQVEPNWQRLAAMPEVKLHLYGKGEPRWGRKMGHLTVMADTVEAARERVLEARAILVE